MVFEVNLVYFKEASKSWIFSNIIVHVRTPHVITDHNKNPCYNNSVHHSSIWVACQTHDQEVAGLNPTIDLVLCP